MYLHIHVCARIEPDHFALDSLFNKHIYMNMITSNLFLVVKLHICAGNSRHLRMIRKSQMLTYLTVSRDSDHLESDKSKSIEKNNRRGGEVVTVFRAHLSDLKKLALNNT